MRVSHFEIASHAPKALVAYPTMIETADNPDGLPEKGIEYQFSKDICECVGWHRFSLLHSRVSPRSDSHDPWVAQTKEILVSGIGMLHYDFPLYLWLMQGGKSLIDIFRSTGGRVTDCPVRYSRIHSIRHDPMYPHVFSNTRAEKTGSTPVLIRCGSDTGRFLWHFTRGRNQPWPGQGWESYLSDLASGTIRVPYTAFDALERILTGRKTVAGGFLIRGGYPVVCLTEASPEEMIHMFHWVPHLRRYRFEPYAVGISIKTARDLGAQPVIYAGSDTFDKLPESDRFRFQAVSRKGRNWESEREWRVPGNIDLSQIKSSDKIVLVPDAHDRKLIAPHTDCHVISILESSKGVFDEPEKAVDY
ncbi:hypothetical protein JXA40_02705 [bacterium]|nr:hypothetical protein [candidate division CSSED10-310 bacterium]